jgi:aerobic C4-dicarboxylate transport protein
VVSSPGLDPDRDSRHPLAGLALLIGVDRFMSEARALTSLASNAVATVVISLSENACDRETLLHA